MRALLSIVPRTTYQNIHRLSRLSWAVIGLCLTHTVRLGAWAEVLESRAQYAASRVRRFSRWLHQPAIHPQQWYAPLLQAALGDWPRNARLYVALDTTALTPFVLIRASLIYRGRALPLAWRAMQHKSTKVAFEDYQPVLEQVRSIGLQDMQVIVLADRGFVHEQLLHYIRTQHWHLRLRLMSNTLVHLLDQPVSAVKDLCPPAGESRFFQHVALLGTAVGPVHLALACLGVCGVVEQKNGLRESGTTGIKEGIFPLLDRECEECVWKTGADGVHMLALPQCRKTYGIYP